MKIGVDICNTVADVLTEIERRLGKYDWHTYYHPNMPESFFEENKDIFLKARPYANAAKVLKELSKEHEIIYITSRPAWAKEYTVQWLKSHDFPNPENVIFTDNKAKAVVENRVKYMIEDAPHEIRKMLSIDVKLIMKVQPYNKDYFYFIRKIVKWDDIMYYFNISRQIA
ncbi:MAG: 5' nucleotidase, NT5C type [Thermovenabulum sp.]|uniref:5' nucleotidase, NT5C type n=1 Tax=Thermovenabulum sp. TaxID=3100335 RepID=UPI003C7A20BE